MKLSLYLNSLNKKKIPMKDLDEDYDSVVKGYTPYVINRCLSYFPDTIIQCNNMNVNNHISKEMHYDYYLHSIRSRGRFSQWLKKEKVEDLELVKEYFGYSDRKAREAMNLLSQEDLEGIKEKMYKGG